jgi:hypothetical protein
VKVHKDTEQIFAASWNARDIELYRLFARRLINGLQMIELRSPVRAFFAESDLRYDVVD